MEFVMTNKIVFKASEDVVLKCSSFKEALDGGAIKITTFDINLVSEDGVEYKHTGDIEVIKNAIIYGLREKG